MHRRDALKALAGIASVAGLTVTPITAKEAEGVELVLIKSNQMMSQDVRARIGEQWRSAVKGTSLEGAKVLVLSDGLDVEIVRQTRT